MKFIILSIALLFSFVSCAQQDTVSIDKKTNKEIQLYIQENYTKKEVSIPMRDGTKLFTSIYTPKGNKEYPVLLQRTPYTCSPYGLGIENFKKMLGPNRYLVYEGYIFAYQDVRGRYMSEGQFDNMRPVVPHEGTAFDESTDTYDTVEWLVKNLDKCNDKVGQYGISYPGHYAAVGAVDAHPALVASSPQAPISDFYFDDFHHNGAFLASYWYALALFGYDKDSLYTEDWFEFPEHTSDWYQFYLDLGPWKNAEKHYKDNYFWQQIVEHPNYDEFWQKRNLLPHLKDIDHAVLTVGGWFDAEDLYGPLNIYQSIEENSPAANNKIIIGPWSHGDWYRNSAHQIIHDIYFGDSISDWYWKNIEAPFFNHHLKGIGTDEIAEATVFDSGQLKWEQYNQWPPKGVVKKEIFLREKEGLSFEKPTTETNSSFVSDPAKPVPHSQDIDFRFTPRPYMTGDQRFASRRPDVLVFKTDELTEDLTLAGSIDALLKVATSESDADWIVKIIDVFPDSTSNHEFNNKRIVMGGYQMMVRSEMIRGRYRNSFEKPEPFISNQVTDVPLKLQDVFHTFKKGHKLMIQIQSTSFPLIDRNPQKYVENIFKAEEADYIKATHTVFHGSTNTSKIILPVLAK